MLAVIKSEIGSNLSEELEIGNLHIIYRVPQGREIDPEPGVALGTSSAY